MVIILGIYCTNNAGHLNVYSGRETSTILMSCRAHVDFVRNRVLKSLRTLA